MPTNLASIQISKTPMSMVKMEVSAACYHTLITHATEYTHSLQNNSHMSKRSHFIPSMMDATDTGLSTSLQSVSITEAVSVLHAYSGIYLNYLDCLDLILYTLL